MTFHWLCLDFTVKKKSMLLHDFLMTFSWLFHDCFMTFYMTSRWTFYWLCVTFKLNTWLDLSWQATTKSLRPLQTEFLLQVLSKSTRTMTVRVIRGDEGVGDIPGIQGDSRGVCRFCARKLDWHKNSDLGSEVGIDIVLNSTTLRLLESVALLTKSIGIWTPLILSIVVAVAQRLISYTKEPRDRIIHEPEARSYCT